MPKLNSDVEAWSVAADRIMKTEVKANTTPQQYEAIKQKARRQAIVDTYGANWEANLDLHGRPQSDCVGSTPWLLNSKDSDCERHYAALERFSGPQTAANERARIKWLKEARGK